MYGRAYLRLHVKELDDLCYWVQDQRNLHKIKGNLIFTQPVVEGNKYLLIICTAIDHTVSPFIPRTSVVHAPEANSSVAQRKPQSMESECGRRRDGAIQ